MKKKKTWKENFPLYSPGTLLRTRSKVGCPIWNVDCMEMIGRLESCEFATVLGPGKFGSIYVDIVTSRGMIGCVLDSCVRSA